MEASDSWTDTDSQHEWTLWPGRIKIPRDRLLPSLDNIVFESTGTVFGLGCNAICISAEQCIVVADPLTCRHWLPRSLLYALITARLLDQNEMEQQDEKKSWQMKGRQQKRRNSNGTEVQPTPRHFHKINDKFGPPGLAFQVQRSS